MSEFQQNRHCEEPPVPNSLRESNLCMGQSSNLDVFMNGWLYAFYEHR